MGVRREAGRLLGRVLVGWLAAVVAAVASLMVADKIRRIIRGQNVAPLPRKDHDRLPVGDGSTMTVYTSGEALFEDMLTAIEQAGQRILLESYIIKGDSTGQRFKSALADAVARGVEVYVIYDGFANLVVRPSFFRFPAPVRVLRYPVWAGGFAVFNPRKWGRDHRKILVVDDTVGFVGGYNVGSLYATQWRDTHLRVEGPAVWDLDNAFVDFWNMQRTPDLPVLDQVGSASWKPQVRAHRNVPRQLLYPIRGMYLEAIDRAKTSIDITAAYFIPDHDILEALITASRRGVRVRILVPRISNHVVTDWLSRGFYGRLLRAGIEIHRYTDHMVHAKTATIDGQWATVGTANIDRLSLLGNYEINLELLDPGFAATMQQVFEDDLLKARRLTRAEWDSRPLVACAYETVLRPLGPLL